MPGSRRTAVAVLAGAVALIAVYLAQWAAVDRLHTGRSDFTSTYVGATLLREGHGASLYDEGLQAPLHARLISPDTEGNLPFVNPPAAAVLALPFTTMGLGAAYRWFSLLQLCLLAAAVVVAVRAAPWPPRLPPEVRPAAMAAGVAGVGTLNLVLLGQWNGVGALGLAVAYALLRRERPGWAGFWLAATATVAKPHLAIGLAAFVLGRRDRRLVIGAVAGVVAVVAVGLAAAGTAGTAGFFHAATSSTTRWPLREMLGFTGLFGSWFGDGAAVHAVAAVASASAAVAAGVLGSRSRGRSDRLEAALGGAVALSLVASPHLLGHDLVMLAPVAAWCLGAAAVHDTTAWPGAATRRVLGLWLLVNVAALLDLGNGRPAPPGRLVPLALLGAAVTAFMATRGPGPATVGSTPHGGGRPFAWSERGGAAGGSADRS